MAINQQQQSQQTMSPMQAMWMNQSFMSASTIRSPSSNMVDETGSVQKSYSNFDTPKFGSSPVPSDEQLDYR